MNRLGQNDWNRIVAHYAHYAPIILARRRDEWAVDPYCRDNGMVSMTPIEALLWGDLREANAIVYPKYPVGRYFVDFANPVVKVAIECDGKAFHQDWRKDAARQDAIEDMGWSVYRIAGRNCHTDFDEETMKPGFAQEFVRDIVGRHRIARGSCATDRARGQFIDVRAGW